jgi:hypothetical protein
MTFFFVGEWEGSDIASQSNARHSLTKCVSVDHISNIWQLQFHMNRLSSAVVSYFVGTDEKQNISCFHCAISRLL